MTTGKTSSSGSAVLLPMAIIGTLFFVFGFITWLNGALIPFLQIVCQLSGMEALLIAFSFYIAYVVMALPMSFVLNKTRRSYPHVQVAILYDVIIKAGLHNNCSFYVINIYIKSFFDSLL